MRGPAYDDFFTYIENNRYHTVCDIGSPGSDPVCPSFYEADANIDEMDYKVRIHWLAKLDSL